MSLSKAPPALMWSQFIVILNPGIDAYLNFFNSVVEFLSKDGSVKFIEGSLVKTLYDVVCLGYLFDNVKDKKSC